MNKHIKDILTEHKNKFAKRRRNTSLLKTIILLSIAYFMIFGAIELLPTIKLVEAKTSISFAEHMDRLTCYDLNEYLKIYPNATINTADVDMCSDYLTK